MSRQWLNENRPPKGPWSAKTTQRRCTALRSFAKFAGHAGILDDYRNPTAAPGYAHPLDGGVAAIEAMLEACSTPEHAALVALCGLCGLRVNEAVSVTVHHIDVPERMLFVHGKGAKDRRIPISSRAFPHLMSATSLAVRSGRERLVPIAERTAREVITRVAARAGISGVSSHDLRMTFGTAAYAATKDLRAVQDLLGHASSKTTELYTGVSAEAMRKAAEL